MTTCEHGDTYCGKPIVAQFRYSDPPGTEGTFWVCEAHIAAAEKCGDKFLRRIPAGGMPIEHFDTRLKPRTKKPSWRELAYMTDDELREVCSKAGIPVRMDGTGMTREDLVEIIVLNHVKAELPPVTNSRSRIPR